MGYHGRVDPRMVRCVRVRPTVLRVLLPMLLALGVAGMHTLGHPGTGHSGMGGPVAMAAAYKQAVVPSLHSMPVMVSTPVVG